MSDSKSTNKTFECFGLVIHGYDLNRVLTEVMTRPTQGQTSWIVTANPEILLYAKNNPNYWEALRQADLRLVDGRGLQIAGWFKGARASRVTGVELAKQLAELCAKRGLTMALIGGKEGVADRAAWYLRRQYPELKVFSEPGGRVSMDGGLDDAAEASLTHLVEIEPDVVLVAYGHPKQELWIQRAKARLPRTNVFMGVGGTFDFWVGDVKRAPQWMRSIGLEWLFRLVREPWRWRRIWNAVVVFPLAVVMGDRKP